ncbi:hypothetical protein HPP92_003786 [Vanilla planifolia]|uniref:Pentatricopeptide repeat-containing protein n=1 Tax=Vanilla planifolia TaxID=51239 RepID=A0A835S2F3_VANPL|nr:hypothetical protein HPP92_003786 [Vanilla planifolia]
MFLFLLGCWFLLFINWEERVFLFISCSNWYSCQIRQSFDVGTWIEAQEGDAMSSFQTTLLPFSSWRLDSMRGSLFCQTSLSLLKKIADTKNLRLGKSIHANLIVSHQCDLIKSNYLINLYAKCGNLSAARHVFDFMPKRNVVSIGSLIAGYFHNGCPSEVLSVFKMIGFGLLDDKPNEFIFSTVLASCSEMLALDAGQQCHAYVLKSGLLFHSYIRNALLHMYSKCSGLEDALGVFQSVTGCDIFSFNSMINVLLEHERLFEAVDILRSMVGKTSQWDHITYVAVLGLSANSKDVTLGRQVHCQIIKRGFMVNVYIGSSTVDMYGKCGDASSALSAFHVLSCRNAISWTAVMDACTKNGCFEETLKLFTEMQVDDVWPNELSYAVVLNACGFAFSNEHW